MKRYLTILTILCAVLALAGMAQAQTTTLSVTVSSEASLTVTGSTTLTDAGNFADYLGNTSLTYKIRTKSGGTGQIQLKVTTDFGSAANSPSVANSGTTGDTLTYTATCSLPGTAPTGAQTASTTASTSVATFGASAASAKTGNAASVAWDLVNDPAYAVATYTATVTFTISTT